MHITRASYGLPNTDQPRHQLIMDLIQETDASTCTGRGPGGSPSVGPLRFDRHEECDGMICRINGLQQEKHNYKVVKLINFMHNKGRWRVEIWRSTGDFLQVRPENLELFHDDVSCWEREYNNYCGLIGPSHSQEAESLQ